MTQMVKLNKFEVHVTKKDMTVYSSLFVISTGLFTPAHTDKVKLGEVYKREMKLGGPNIITQGCQSYMLETEAMKAHRMMREEMFECIIPKGTRYIIGMDTDNSLKYASDGLIYLKQISWLY